MSLGRQFIHNTPSGYAHYYVYALFCADGKGPGYVKIGHTMNIRLRLTQLRVACPVPAKMFAIADIGPNKKLVLKIEREFHRRFNDRCISGEWFRFDFSRGEDKKDFNAGSKYVFSSLGKNAPWWEKINVPVLDEFEEQRRNKFCTSKFGRRILTQQRHKEAMGL